jgi:hypothetical protein
MDAAARDDSDGGPRPVSAPLTREDRRHVGLLALASLLALALVWGVPLVVAPAFAPRVNVRWAEGVDEAARTNAERQLNLLAGAQLDGRTWAYDLADASPQAVAAVVAHPSVEDTHHIDRSSRVVTADAPQGTTRIRGGLSLLREAILAPWVSRFAWSVLIVSALWLATAGRSAATGGARRQEIQSREPRR